jgi:DNA helicase-2/ATP-dependent DNA helicase PcrA
MAGLNDMQDKACKHIDGPLLILAGAGSGKTRVITHRAAYLIKQGINPYNILAITFTNKAAKEMRERIDNIVGEEAHKIWVSTFHSMCVRILRRFADRLGYDTRFTIYDSDDSKALIKDILKYLQIDSKKYPEKMFMGVISSAKEQYKTPDQLERESETDYNMKRVAQVYREYQKRLKTNNAFDFDDLIYKTVELFEHNPDVLMIYQDKFRYIMVDEYQDTNHIQFLLVKMLAARYRNLCVVGDDDQSIYKFRGANIYNILNFEEEYPDAMVVKLEQNYRSVGNILSAANAVIRNNTGRKDKALWTDKQGGEKISFRQYENEYMEAEGTAMEISRLAYRGVDYRNIAILYRTNAQSRIFEEKLLMRNIPYRIVGGTNFYSRKEIKDALCYLKVLNNDNDALPVKRIINVPKRGIGQSSIDKVESYAVEHGMTLMEALNKVEDIPGMSRAVNKIKEFTALIDELQEMVYNKESLSNIYDAVLEKSGYEDMLIAEHTDESMGRLENLDELRNKVVTYEEDMEDADLPGLLEEIALVSDLDSLDEDDDRVRLMTLHSAKGLEFPYVFIGGMEERMFPSGMALNSDDEDALEEERRLCYVGKTRAMEKLYLSAAKMRMVHGSTNINDVSRFIREIPANLFDDEDMVKKRSKPVLSAAAKPYAEAKNYGKTNPYKSPGKPAFGKEFTVNRAVSLDYGEGDRVRHVKFGEGTVTKLVSGGKDYEVTVDFDRVGIKKMFASFAKLKKI